MSESQIIPLVMPKWGLSMREGRVEEWLVSEGEEIAQGTPLLNVQSDKIANAVEATDGGLLRRRVAQQGEVLPVKALLAVLAPPQVSEAQIDAFIAGWVVVAAAGTDPPPQDAGQYVEVEGLRLHYLMRGRMSGGLEQEGDVPPGQPQAGETGNTLLFLHGFGGDLNNWLFNLDAFPQSRVVALDLPGHGRSDTRLSGSRLADLARIVAGFMQALGLPAAHVIGHSLGGAVAARLALDAPQRVRSLALIGSAGFGREINSTYTRGFVDAQSRRELKPVIELLFADPSRVSRQLLDDLLKVKRLDGVQQSLDALHNALFAGGKQAELPGQQLDGHSPPLLLIWGEQDAIVPASHARQAPIGSEVVVLSGAGHMPQMEQATEVNRLLQRFTGAG